jgi:pyruvate/2-oxoglutarate/acetoin dehydrogenase E1 component
MRPCKEAVSDLADDHGIDVELIDLLTISPMDTETLAASVQKTGRCVIVNEGQRTCGVAAEIMARLNEVAFEYLEAPIKRITGFDVPFPYFQVEEHFLAESEEIVVSIKETLDWQ